MAGGGQRRRAASRTASDGSEARRSTSFRIDGPRSVPAPRNWRRYAGLGVSDHDPHRARQSAARSARGRSLSRAVPRGAPCGVDAAAGTRAARKPTGTGHAQALAAVAAAVDKGSPSRGGRAHPAHGDRRRSFARRARRRPARRGHSWPEATTAKDVPKNCSYSAVQALVHRIDPSWDAPDRCLHASSSHAHHARHHAHHARAHLAHHARPHAASHHARPHAASRAQRVNTFCHHLVRRADLGTARRQAGPRAACRIP